MGHIRLGSLQRSKKWPDVIGLLDSKSGLESVTEASETDLKRASDDPFFQFVTQLLVRMPLLARAPSFEVEMADMGLSPKTLTSVTGML